MSHNKCFICKKPLGKNPALVDTRDDQVVYVGSNCFKKVVAAGEQGIPVTDCGNLRVYYPITNERWLKENQ